MAYQITQPDRYVELAGVPLNTPAWELTNIHVLLAPPPTRGSNVVIPGANGTKPRRRRITERSVSLELYLFGTSDAEGVAHADPNLGLLINIATLQALVLTPPPTASSTITATVHWQGASATGDVQVVGMEIGEKVNPVTVTATIDLIIPQGALQ
jgi:hypothetical protein